MTTGRINQVCSLQVGSMPGTASTLRPVNSSSTQRAMVSNSVCIRILTTACMQGMRLMHLIVAYTRHVVWDFELTFKVNSKHTQPHFFARLRARHTVQQHFQSDTKHPPHVNKIQCSPG